MMIDREKVLKGLDCCSDLARCEECPYDQHALFIAECTSALAKDALELLKEQEDRIGVLNKAIEQTPKPTKLLDVFGDGYAKVVRCKDCKHWWKKNELCTHEKTMDGSVCCLEAKPDFYCGYGERR